MFTRLLFMLCFLLICMLTITSCEYEIIEFEKVDPTVEVKFSSDILPIFNNKCNVAGCHTVGHGVIDLSAANAYNDLNTKNFIDTDYPAESRLYKILVNVGSSHTGRSTPAEQDLILQWIKQGAKNN